MLCLINKIYSGINTKYNSSYEDVFVCMDVFLPGHLAYHEKIKSCSVSAPMWLMISMI